MTVVVGDTPVSFGSGDAYYITTTLAREQRISDERLSNSDDYTVEFGERYFPRLRLNTETDEFERPSHTWVYENTELGTYVDYDLLVETYTEGVDGRTLYELLGSSTIDEYSIAYYVDGAESDVIRESNMIRTNTRDYSTTGNGVLTQVFVDHTNEEITITSVNTYLAQTDADYNESRGELSLTVYTGTEADGTAITSSKTVDVEDIDTITEYTEGDFMLVNMAATGTGSNPYEVVRVNDVESMVDCTVTRFSKGSYVTVDGEQYDYAETAAYDDDVLDQYNEGALDDFTYTFYLDQYGYVIGAEIYEGEANYLFLTGYDMNGSNLSVSTATAAAIFLDGTMEEIQVNVGDTNDNIDDYNDGLATDRQYYELSRLGNPNADGTYGDDGESEYNRWFRYTVNSNDVYTLTPVTTWVNETVATGGDVINSANVRVGTGSNRAYGNDASIYITVDTGDVDLTTAKGITKVNGTYTGIQEVDMDVYGPNNNGLNDTNDSIFALYDDDNYIIAAVVLGEDSNNTQNYAYILDTEAQSEYTEDGDTYWDVEAVVNNEIVTLTIENYGRTITNIKNDLDSNKYARGALYRVTYNAEGHVIEAELCEDLEYADTNASVDDYVYGSEVNNGTAGRYDYNTRDIDPDIDSVYVVQVNNAALNLRGRTLYIGAQEDYGLFLASGANIFVVQDEEDSNGDLELSVEQYTSASAALNSLLDDEDFNGTISAVLTDAGTAEYLVINSNGNIPIDTDDGTTSSGNVETIYDDSVSLPDGTTLRGSSANATFNVNQYGILSITMEYTAPAWVPSTATVDLVAPLYYGSTYVGSVNFGTARLVGGKATVTYTSTSFGQFLDYNASSFSLGTLTQENFSDVNAYWFEATSHENLASTLTGETETVTTDSTAPINLTAKLVNSTSTGNAPVNVTNGTVSGSAPYTMTPSFAQLASASGWTSTKTVYADGDAPVIITMDLGSRNDTYGITAASSVAAAVDVDGTPGAAGIRVDALGVSGTNDDIVKIQSATDYTTDLSEFDRITLSATIEDGDDTAIGAAAYNVVVTLSTGDRLTFSNVLAEGAGVDATFDMPAADVEITDIRVEVATPLVDVTSVTSSGNRITIVFNTAIATSDAANANFSVTGTNSVALESNGVTLSSDGKTVTLQLTAAATNVTSLTIGTSGNEIANAVNGTEDGSFTEIWSGNNGVFTNP